MTELIPLLALGASDPRVAEIGNLRLVERADLALSTLAVPIGTDRPRPLGLDLPEPGGWSEQGETAAFWVGAEQWMMARSGGADACLADAVKRDCPDCTVTDQTDGWIVVEIVSSEDPVAIEEALERLVNLDPVNLRPGSAVRTELDHMAVVVIRPAEQRLMVLGMRSFAQSLWHALTTVASRL